MTMGLKPSSGECIEICGETFGDIEFVDTIRDDVRAA